MFFKTALQKLLNLYEIKYFKAIYSSLRDFIKFCYPELRTHKLNHTVRQIANTFLKETWLCSGPDKLPILFNANSFIKLWIPPMKAKYVRKIIYCITAKIFPQDNKIVWKQQFKCCRALIQFSANIIKSIKSTDFSKSVSMLEAKIVILTRHSWQTRKATLLIIQYILFCHGSTNDCLHDSCE